MREANTAVVRERHPIPTVDEVLEELKDSTLFSRLDLRWGFHQIELDETSRYITTFSTHEGLFQYNRLNFGITSAPEVFQRIVQQVLSGLKGARSIADDIIVFGNENNHDARLEAVLQRLSEKGLTLNKDKCEFRVSKTTFMGHVLTPMGVAPDELKTKAVREARAPTNPAEVRSFLGLVTYMAKFVKDLATLADPLRELTREATKWNWGRRQEEAFQELKERLTNAEMMAYFDKDAKTEVIVDASPVGIGAILSQQQKNGEYRPVYYASRSLTSVERRYSQTEKEALAVVWGCERFSLYLVGKEFDLITDHKPLETIYSSKRTKPLPRIERWVLRLQPFAFKVKYRQGKDNAADALSRLPLASSSTERNMADQYCYTVLKEATPKAFTTAEVEQESAKDSEIRELRKHVQNGLQFRADKRYQKIFPELSTMGMIVMRGGRIVMPRSLRSQTLHLAHEGHQGIVRTKQRLREKVWWPGIDAEAEELVRQCHLCQVVTRTDTVPPMTRTDLPDGPWQQLAIDLCGPFPSGESILVVVDYYSRWTEVKIVKSTTAGVIIKCLKAMFATHGIPTSIISDNGPQFVSSEYKDFLSENGIECKHTTPYWPQANGEVERQNRTILKSIRASTAGQKKWQEELWRFLLAYRTTAHAVTGVSPAELLMNRRLRTKMPEITTINTEDNVMRERDQRLKDKGKMYGDYKRKAEETDIEEGDLVLLEQRKQNKLSSQYEVQPYEVTEKKGNSLVLASPNHEKQIMRSSAQVKKFIVPETRESTTQEAKMDITNKEPEIHQRPQRDRRPPDYLKNFVPK